MKTFINKNNPSKVALTIQGAKPLRTDMRDYRAEAQDELSRSNAMAEVVGGLVGEVAKTEYHNKKVKLERSLKREVDSYRETLATQPELMASPEGMDKARDIRDRLKEKTTDLISEAGLKKDDTNNYFYSNEDTFKSLYLDLQTKSGMYQYQKGLSDLQEESTRLSEDGRQLSLTLGNTEGGYIDNLVKAKRNTDRQVEDYGVMVSTASKDLNNMVWDGYDEILKSKVATLNLSIQNDEIMLDEVDDTILNLNNDLYQYSIVEGKTVIELTDQAKEDVVFQLGATRLEKETDQEFNNRANYMVNTYLPSKLSEKHLELEKMATNLRNSGKAYASKSIKFTAETLNNKQDTIKKWSDNKYSYDLTEAMSSTTGETLNLENFTINDTSKYTTTGQPIGDTEFMKVSNIETERIKKEYNLYSQDFAKSRREIEGLLLDNANPMLKRETHNLISSYNLDNEGQPTAELFKDIDFDINRGKFEPIPIGYTLDEKSLSKKALDDIRGFMKAEGMDYNVANINDVMAYIQYGIEQGTETGVSNIQLRNALTNPELLIDVIKGSSMYKTIDRSGDFILGSHIGGKSTYKQVPIDPVRTSSLATNRNTIDTLVNSYPHWLNGTVGKESLSNRVYTEEQAQELANEIRDNATREEKQTAELFIEKILLPTAFNEKNHGVNSYVSSVNNAVNDSIEENDSLVEYHLESNSRADMEEYNQELKERLENIDFSSMDYKNQNSIVSDIIQDLDLQYTEDDTTKDTTLEDTTKDTTPGFKIKPNEVYKAMGDSITTDGKNIVYDSTKFIDKPETKEFFKDLADSKVIQDIAVNTAGAGALASFQTIAGSVAGAGAGTTALVGIGTALAVDMGINTTQWVHKGFTPKESVLLYTARADIITDAKNPLNKAYEELKTTYLDGNIVSEFMGIATSDRDLKGNLKEETLDYLDVPLKAKRNRNFKAMSNRDNFKEELERMGGSPQLVDRWLEQYDKRNKKDKPKPW